MNWEERKLRLFRAEEAKRLEGEAAYRAHALQHLKLKTVVKVGHERRRRGWLEAAINPRLRRHGAAHVCRTTSGARPPARTTGRPQESHASTIQGLAFNHTVPDLHNLFCTVGKDQVPRRVALFGLKCPRAPAVAAAASAQASWLAGWLAD